MTARPRDLFLLVADADIEQTMRGLLESPERLGIRSISWEIQRHPERDAGCARHSVDFLRLFYKQFHHALVMFDHEGSGRESESREGIESSMEHEFAQNGWREGAVRAIVLEPEVEAWVWSPSPHVAKVLGWEDWDVLRQWMVDREFICAGAAKPGRPKETMLAALRERRLPRSASLFKKLAQRVSHQGCEDPAFAKLRSVLREWFGATRAVQ